MGNNLKKERAKSYRREGRELLVKLIKHGRNREFFINATLTIAQLKYAEGNKNVAMQIVNKMRPLNNNEIMLKNQ